MRKYYSLFVKNRIGYDITDDIGKFSNYLLITQGINLIYDVVETNLDLRHKDFGIKISSDKTAWGLDGIKEQLRQANVAIDGQYHLIVFLYDLKEWNFSDKPLGAWCYPNDLHKAAFVEIPSTFDWEQVDELFRMLTHENLHAEHRICWWKGIPTRDTMDSGEIEVDCSTGEPI